MFNRTTLQKSYSNQKCTKSLIYSTRDVMFSITCLCRCNQSINLFAKAGCQWDNSPSSWPTCL